MLARLERGIREASAFLECQETIDPLALVEELRAESQGRQPEEQLGFFAPYTDLTFEEKVDFYRHPGKWSNRMILGDSLLVMTSLAEKEGVKGHSKELRKPSPGSAAFTVGQAAVESVNAATRDLQGDVWADLCDLERQGLTVPLDEALLAVAHDVRGLLTPLGSALIAFVERPAAS